MRLPHIQPFNKTPLYFFTACVEERRALLANKATMDLLVGIWTRAADHDGWYVGRFMIMPDHVHFFAMPNSSAIERGKWHKLWKSVSSRRLMREFHLAVPVWQDDTFDHIMRSADSYAAKWDYVRQNPVRAGLCARSEDWPWQGEIHTLRF